MTDKLRDVRLDEEPRDTDGKLDILVSEEAAATGSNNGDYVSLLASSLSWLPRIFPFKDSTFIKSLIRYLFDLLLNIYN